MTADEYTVPELREPADVLVDEFGVPHIYATSEHDVFLAQGFNAARDRMFQLDLWRRRGLGRLAEVFGARFVERDRAARLFVYRGDMHAEWLAYGSATKRIATAFVAGVNTYVRLCRENRALLPPEFQELGYLPAFWEPSDIAVIRSHGLFPNVEQEVARARTLRDFGAEVEDLRRVREPAHELRVPEGLDLDLIPDDVLDVYRLATTPPDLSAVDLPRARTVPEGSNNWAVAGHRTATGRPLLANDPHRAITLPSLRYLAHLVAPGLDVIGAGEPVLPGVSVGHNGSVAFGFTVFEIDQEDLYVYRTNPDAPDEYEYAGRWEPMRVERETVAVADGPDVEVELRFTRHGPVIYADPQRHTAFAVRAAWLHPGMAPYLGSVDSMRARTADEYVDAMNRWGAPGENHVYATDDGTIGWRPAGLTPIRPNWDGTLPVPGDGRYEWAGFYDMDELPSSRDPAEGWIATANEMNLPPDYPNADRTLTYDWHNRFRRARIGEVLDASTDVTVADCVALQTDTVNASARRVLSALDDLTPADDDAKAATVLLREWDCAERVDSPAAALYELWLHRHLRPALVKHRLAALVPTDRLVDAVQRLLPSDVFGPDVRSDLALLDPLRDRRAELDPLLTETLASAYGEARRLLGDDTTEWRWGALHHAALTHPLHGLLDAEWTRLPRVETAGSADTVRAAKYDANFAQTAGASFRIVVDVGDWDRSVAMNTPGQSGRPDDPHYADLYADWAADRSFPLCYSRAAVEAHTAFRYRLVP